MLPTLSRQERTAVRHYDEQIRSGDTSDTQLWLDEFSYNVYHWIGPEHDLIDVGCRIGRAIPMFQQLGVTKYFGIDPSEECVRYCKTQFPQYQFAVDEIRTIGDHYPDRFDAFFLVAVLMHLPRKDLGEAIRSLRRSLKVGAGGMFATPLGIEGHLEERNEFVEKLTLFTFDELAEAFAGNGFEVPTMFSRDSHMILGSAVAV